LLKENFSIISNNWRFTQIENVPMAKGRAEPISPAIDALWSIVVESAIPTSANLGRTCRNRPKPL
jgi:hypothetical protein